MLAGIRACGQVVSVVTELMRGLGRMPVSDNEVNEEPPPGPPWDLPMHEAPLALVDLEMTGLDPKVDRVIEICIVRRVGGAIAGKIETLVDPGENAHFGTDVHGL